MFDGHPDAIDDAMYLMESLQLHAKVLMEMKVPAKPGYPEEMYGPVFQYELEDTPNLCSGNDDESCQVPDDL